MICFAKYVIDLLVDLKLHRIHYIPVVGIVVVKFRRQRQQVDISSYEVGVLQAALRFP